MMVDLHAAEVDQRLALAAGIVERRERLVSAAREDSFSFYVQCVGLEAAFFPRFGQADRVKDSGRHAVAIGGPHDFRLARVGGGARGAGSSQARYRYRRQRAREEAKPRG